MAKQKSYAVAIGKTVGIYKTWAECEKQVKGVKGAKFKSFAKKEDAETYLQQNNHSSTSSTSTSSTSTSSTSSSSTSTSSTSSTSTSSTSASAAATVAAEKSSAARPLSSSLFSEEDETEQRPKNPPSKRPRRTKIIGASDTSTTTSTTTSPTTTTNTTTSTSSSTTSTSIKLWFHMTFDGGSRGNPGLAGAGTEIITRIAEREEPASKSNNNDNDNDNENDNGNENDTSTTRTKRKYTTTAAAATTTKPTTGTQIIIRRTKAQIRAYLPGSKTNNQAEYAGIVSGLEYVLHSLTTTTTTMKTGTLIKKDDPYYAYPQVTLVVQGDSNLIIQQLNGKYKCNSVKLQPLYQRAKQLLRSIKANAGTYQQTLEHVYRKDNAIADALANEAMDGERSWTTIVDENGDVKPDSFKPSLAV